MTAFSMLTGQSRAWDLFSRLEAGGVATLDRLIEDRDLESLFLDFKQSPQDQSSSGLSKEQNKILSKAISGFANSSGGVIIWGVDCRIDKATKCERAEKVPLMDAGAFRSKIESAISRATFPPHPGVRTIAIQSEGRLLEGFVVAYVPKSEIGPLRAIATDQYHFRSGSSFQPIPHDVLAGMFGRAPQPTIDINFLSNPIRVVPASGGVVLTLGLVLVNLGAVIGERPYISMQYLKKWGASSYVRVVRPDAYQQANSGGIPVASVVSQAGVFIAPGGADYVCDLIIEVPAIPLDGVDIQCTFGVLGAPPRRFNLCATENDLRDAIACGESKIRQTGDILVVRDV